MAMRARRRGWLAPWLLIAALLVACGGTGATPTPAPAPPATVVATPAAPPTPAPGATASRVAPGSPTPPPAATATRSATASPGRTATAGGDGGARLLLNADGENDRYLGIARFRGASACTGTLIATSTLPGAPAYLLTNGHCTGSWGSNDVLRDQPAQGARAIFNYFVDTRERQIDVAVKGYPYSTMKGVDLALVELDATLGELAARGVRPLPLAGAPPVPGAAIAVVGAPATGIPPEQAYLRLGSCALGAPVTVIERQWMWHETYRNTCPDISGGSSGSPVLAAGSGEVLAVINTTTQGSAGLTDCYLGRPCEVGVAGYRVSEGTNYGNGVLGLRACFDAAGRFALDGAGCPLDRGRQPTLGGYKSASRPVRQDAAGQLGPVTWGITLGGGDWTHYRYKIGAVGGTDCRDLAGYGQPLGLAARPTIDDPVPQAEGFYVACILGGPGPDTTAGSWQEARFASFMPLKIDTTPPRGTPRVQVGALAGSYTIEPIFDPPEYSAFNLKYGPAASTDCADPAGYLPYRRIPIRVAAGQVPLVVCVIGYDEADNAAPPRVVPVP